MLLHISDAAIIGLNHWLIVIIPRARRATVPVNLFSRLEILHLADVCR